MAEFLIERTVPLSLDEAWRRVTDWPRHGQVVPFTRVTADGRRVRARTGVGPVGFLDLMEITVWSPPGDGDAGGVCRLEKRGRVVLGWAELEVRPGPGGRARVLWREDVRLRFLPSFLDGAVRFAGRYVFGRALNRLLRRA
ncbi:SRPBCC family protein [Streptomyces abyssomicinicus]|uniref:SRPBCC family protein n=1 Tax=Streptomyces abyssomicinicus TaxID=574929 RepID=UPI0012502CDC|nr:SRPBCC family protein [Streptomyces abyssomicinicus]